MLGIVPLPRVGLLFTDYLHRLPSPLLLPHTTAGCMFLEANLKWRLLKVSVRASSKVSVF